ncbi:MAG TPA: hypothetical protein VKX28_26855 [Xanthobacteraceae bacterium]|nr:hypothetical protein [Xanthobacteraceae bacterium]
MGFPGLQAFQQNFPAPQTSIIGPNGTFTTDGRYLLLALWNRTGGASGAPSVGVGLVVQAGTSFPIVNDWSEFDTVPNGGSVIIPGLKVGASAVIFNGGANALSVLPQPGSRIDALAVGAGYPLAAGKTQIFSAWSPTQLRSLQLG